MLFSEINLLAVLVTGVAAMIVGGLWYSPVLFGNLWMKLSGITKEQIEEAKKKGMAVSYLANFIGALVMSYILAAFIVNLNLQTITEALFISFLIWLGFFVTIALHAVLWEGKSLKLFWLNIAYLLVMILVSGVILVSWK